MNKIDILFKEKKKNILSIYFTAGYPKLGDTCRIINDLEQAGVDLIEIGIPFSDPLADGPVIQQSSLQALHNGMNLKLLFDQLQEVKNTSIPKILMGYYNSIYQYGIENFCKSCVDNGVDGVIIPDFPPEEYKNKYIHIFENYGLHMIFLVTPQSTDERIQKLALLSKGFLYLVSSFGTTGKTSSFDTTVPFLERIQRMNLQIPTLVGFGIDDSISFNLASKYANGAIIGSAFIKSLENNNNTNSFINTIQNQMI
ncbi:MAG: tryptophan synthase subunit alpha [Bacteroidales bacterium]|nr:tryptophan synthase subunit alpha [Bacteroidales bacterium]